MKSNLMKIYILIIFASLMMVSCVDTIILPNDKTVEEDFWQKKSDVTSMVMEAYRTMISSDVMERLIVWGDFRSDELTMVTSFSNSTTEALTEIDAQNIQPTNAFVTWAPFYSVINNCNIVLDKSQQVMSIDPSYTQGDYDIDCAQMLALRSLCYFYLVRNFRDVPYSAHAYMNSSEEMNIPQVSPDSVLHNCIRDLEYAETHAYDPTAFTDWRRTGLFTRDAVQTLLADIYLWLGSAHHSDYYYGKCVEYCDKVIASKQAQYVPSSTDLEKKEYPLADGDKAFKELYVTQNAEESILELQFNAKNSNTSLCQMLYKYSDNSSTSGYLRASSIFGKNGNGAALYTKTSDYRYLQNVFFVASDKNAEAYDVRKMTTNISSDISNPISAAGYSRVDRPYDQFVQDYIVYRLADVMLMKAEAQTALAKGSDDIQLRQAFNLVQAVNSRSLYQPSLAADSLKWSYYNTKDGMENLVLDERLRELCFEGKRWYDLIRYNYRHVDGVDYTKTFSEQTSGSTDGSMNFVHNNETMLNLATRKYSSGASAAAAKMRTEPYLYLPVNESDLKVNPQLKQNPVYSTDKEYKKNY